jgi:hypothetical protein
VKKEPEMEYQESLTVQFRNKETGETYSGNKMHDDSPCAICEKKFSEHSVEMHKALRADRAAGAAACGADFVVRNEEATVSIPVSSPKPKSTNAATASP